MLTVKGGNIYLNVFSCHFHEILDIISAPFNEVNRSIVVWLQANFELKDCLSTYLRKLFNVTA